MRGIGKHLAIHRIDDKIKPLQGNLPNQYEPIVGDFSHVQRALPALNRELHQPINRKFANLVHGP